MTALLVWLGSGFAFAIGVVAGVWLMRFGGKNVDPTEDTAATKLLYERNTIGYREASALEDIGAAIREQRALRIAFKKLHPDATRPVRKLNGGAWDLFPIEKGYILPGQTKTVRLGFATAFSEDYVAVIDDRGSTGKLSVTHLAGVVDGGYRDEWLLLLHNLGIVRFEYGPDKAAAQVLFHRVVPATWADEEVLPGSERGARAFGSTDQK